MKEHIAGYAGHRPQTQQVKLAERIAKNPGNLRCIPGYSGYMYGVVPENIYGKTFTMTTKEVKESDQFREDKVILINFSLHL